MVEKEKRKWHLVRYLRNENRAPIAVVVAIGPELVGYAVCSKKDAFCKERGRNIAADRAIKGSHAVFDNEQYRRSYKKFDPELQDFVKCDLKTELASLIESVKEKSRNIDWQKLYGESNASS